MHPILRIEHGWYQDLIEFLQYGLPKILVTLLLAFVLLQVTKFFVKRMLHHADRLVANSRRASQIRTLASIVRATAYSLILAYIALQVLSAVGRAR